MRVALIHTWDSSSDVGDRVWSALCRAWPNADRFTSDIWQSTDVDGWRETAPRRLQLLGQGLPRQNQLLSRLPLDPDRHSVLLSGYDVVISTSVAAAQMVSVEADAAHLCFMGTEAVHHPRQTIRQPAPTVPPSSVSPMDQVPSLYQHHAEEFSLPAATSGVTHFLATSHTVAAQYHFDLHHQPYAVLYPPIDTTFFRPGPEAHANYYLLVCHPGVAVDVGLVIAACEAAQRDLVILGGECLRDQVGVLSQRVRWEPLPADFELRSHMRHCRALLSVAPTGMDPALVEAQACGTPVIAYHGASTEQFVLDAERTGLGTGLFFHTMTANSLVSAMRELERRPQNISAVLSLAQAEKFSPAHFEHGLASQLARWCRDRSVIEWKPAPTIPLPSQAEPAGQRLRAA